MHCTSCTQPPDLECQPLLAYGEVNRGSIRVRKDPKDQQEWQFCLETAIVYSDKQSKHEMNMEAATKLEAIQWMEARKAGTMLSPEEGLAANALNDVLPTSAKKRLKSLQLSKTKSQMKKVMQKMRKKIANKSSMQLQRKLTSCQRWGEQKQRAHSQENLEDAQAGQANQCWPCKGQLREQGSKAPEGTAELPS